MKTIYSVDNDDDDDDGDDDDGDEGEYDDNDDNPSVGIDGNSERDWFIILCKGISDSLGFWIPHWGFWIPGTGFQYFSVELGFWITKFLLVGFQIPWAVFQIPQAKISWIPESEFPYMGRDTLYNSCH